MNTTICDLRPLRKLNHSGFLPRRGKLEQSTPTFFMD